MVRLRDSSIVKSPLFLSDFRSSLESLLTSFEAWTLFLEVEKTINDALAIIITIISRMKVFLNISVALID